MAAMEAVLAARRSPVAEAKPEAARGPGADLRFQACGLVDSTMTHAGSLHGTWQSPWHGAHGEALGAPVKLHHWHA